MVVKRPHLDIVPAPGGRCWRRSDRRRPGATPQAHAELVVLLGLDGRAQYLLDGQIRVLTRGVLLWALAGQEHVLLSETPGFDMWVFLVSERVLTPELAASPEMPPLAIANAAQGLAPRNVGAIALRSLDRMAGEISSVQMPILQAAGLRWWLARAWAAWDAAPDAIPGNLVHPAVAHAARRIRDDPTLSLARIAQSSGVSQNRLGRVFREQTGQGLLSYRKAHRLIRAETLHDQGATWLSAALEAGFGSYTAFYRAHVAARGCAPRRSD